MIANSILVFSKAYMQYSFNFEESQLQVVNSPHSCPALSKSSRCFQDQSSLE